MELIRGLHNLRPQHRCAATIGNFDGVHRGHQAILEQLAHKAGELALPSLLMTFEPLPWEYFDTDNAPTRLMGLREKVCALHRYGIDRFLLLRFDARLAALSARDFIARILVDRLGVQYLLVGEDFRFGCGREGDFAMLANAARQFDFEIERAPTVRVNGTRVSSTRVREALKRGDMGGAQRLLGQPYFLCGRVVSGDRRGRELGYPTANLRLRRQAPVRGIFVVEATIAGENVLRGVASLGRRPMFELPHDLLEVYLFDFSGDLYGQRLKVDLLHKLRDEAQFESVDALKAQMACDVEAAQVFFRTRRQFRGGIETV